VIIVEEFSTSLLREKFIVKDKVVSSSGKIIEVKSNRVFFTLGTGSKKENLVIRSKQAYISIIMASRILRDYFFEDEDPILKRVIPIDWQALWATTLSDYEKEYNPELWCAVYVNGNSVFQYQEPEFVDVIERCANVVPSDYGSISETLEDMIERAGEHKKVEYVSDFASTMYLKNGKVSCSVINNLSANNKSAFNLDISGGDNIGSLVEESLLVSAAFLEIFDLRFFISKVQAQIDNSEIDENHENVKRMRSAIVRTNKVHEFISEMEAEYNIEYFPERPNF